MLFRSPGPNEGVQWSNIKIYESPDDLTTNSAGNLQFVYGSTRRLTVNNTGIDVNGNIVVSGTVDGRDVAADGSKLDGIACGATANTGDITAVTAGTGLCGGGTSGSVTLTLDMSELSDMTATMTGSDEFIVLDSSADRRKAACEIGLSIFNNDAGFTTNNGDITNVTASNGLCGGGSSGSVTICHCDTSSQSSVNNSSGTVIQDVTLDGFGHVTGLGSCNMDNRYYLKCTVDNCLAGKQASGTYNTIIGTDSDINTSGCTVVDQLNMTDGVIT